MESPRLQKYKRSSPFGYHHEKIALIKLAQHLRTAGWGEVLLSVRPESLDGPLTGIDPATIPGVDVVGDVLFSGQFQEQFDNDLDHRYTFFGDRPGGVDLVARTGSSLLLVEAKGESKRDRKGAVYELLGRQVAAHVDDDERRFGILIPDSWQPVLPAWRPSLDWLEIFLIERESGAIEETKLPK